MSALVGFESEVLRIPRVCMIKNELSIVLAVDGPEAVVEAGLAESGLVAIQVACYGAIPSPSDGPVHQPL